MQKGNVGIRHLGITLLVALINIHNPLAAQFEQKLSVNISGGYFNTLGKTGIGPDGAQGSEMEPTLMPNFKGGPSFSAGIQYNFSRHFSTEFHVSYMFAPGWYFDYSDAGAEPFNYLYYEVVTDSILWVVEESGENYMDLGNLQIGIAPRYYFMPGKKVNPFLFAGITLNSTYVYFENNEYEAFKRLDMLDQYEENYELANWFDYHFGVGIMAGVGIELVISDYLGLFLQGSYDFIPLKESAFVNGNKYVDFHAINIHLGARISFLKSKDL